MAFSFLAYPYFRFEDIPVFFIMEIRKSDDVIGGSTKTSQHSIDNNSRNISAVFFKLGTSNVHHRRNRMTPTMLLPWQHSWLQFLSVKNKYPHLQPFEVDQRVLLGTHMVPILS